MTVAYQGLSVSPVVTRPTPPDSQSMYPDQPHIHMHRNEMAVIHTMGAYMVHRLISIQGTVVCLAGAIVDGSHVVIVDDSHVDGGTTGLLGVIYSRLIETAPEAHSLRGRRQVEWLTDLSRRVCTYHMKRGVYTMEFDVCMNCQSTMNGSGERCTMSCGYTRR